MTAPAIGPLAPVEWHDSHRPDGWTWLKPSDDHSPMLIRTVGWVVEQPDPAALVLAPTLSLPDRDGDRQALGLLRMPDRAVVARRELAEPET